MAEIGVDEADVTLDVRTDMDVGRARRAAAPIAGRAGLDRYACEAVAISVSELATNLVRHARGGRIRIRALEELGRAGLEIDACDIGPGIPDIARAMEDNYSTGGTLGNGLGAVRRLMDEFSIESVVGEGTRVVARKWRE